MEAYLEREYYLRTSDFDCREQLRISSVLDLFQDVAGLHAKTLGCGFEELLNKKLLWVIVRVKFEVLKDVKMYDKIKVKTWPLKPGRAEFRREYFIEDENGEVVVRGSSDWVLMHSEKRRLMPAKGIFPDDAEYRTQCAIEGKLSKLHDFEADENPKTVIPGFCDIDLNRHVNNIKYADFAMNSVDLKEEERIKAFQIDYRHEVKHGEILNVLSKRADGKILIKGLNSAGEIMFVCEMDIQK